MRVLILGADGQLGSELVNEYESRSRDIVLCKADISDFDVSDRDETMRFILGFSPELIFNCAAYTNVDGCENNSDLAFRVNATGSRNVAESANACDASVVYISTDYVFDGRKNSPYTEFDTPYPLNIYGRSKLEGEEFVRKFADKFYIIRTSWLYGKHGHNFLKTILSLSKKQSEIRVVNDQVGTPTDTKSLARQVLRIIDNKIYGIYNASCNGECSWYEFAREIVRLSGLDTEVIPIKTEEYPLPAKRPRYSVLDNYMMRMDDIDIMPDWKDSLTTFFKENRVEDLT